MKQQAQNQEEKYCYKLPFEKNSFRLTEETLNANSDFRRPGNHFPVQIRRLHFRNEILTLGVKLTDEAEALVYLKVKANELLVSCSFDTDRTYLSRFAYFCLIGLMGYHEVVCFRKYYWPDFFDRNTGRSQFLQIFNDRKGLDIAIKSKYPAFYKPGDALPDLQNEPDRPKVKTSGATVAEPPPTTGYALGYCLADTQLTSMHSNHFPFLVPFQGILSHDKEKIKSFTSYISNADDMEPQRCSLRQAHLNTICFKMRELAPIGIASYQARSQPNDEESERGKQLFELWHKALPLVLAQKHLYFHHTHGMKNLKGKPRKKHMHACEIRKEPPQLLVKKIDKGAYYQFELRFKVNGKVYVPASPNITFFINPSVDGSKLFLLESYNDYLLTSFFAKTQFKLAVLKCHYKARFEDFIESLGARNEMKEL